MAAGTSCLPLAALQLRNRPRFRVAGSAGFAEVLAFSVNRLGGSCNDLLDVEPLGANDLENARRSTGVGISHLGQFRCEPAISSLMENDIHAADSFFNIGHVAHVPLYKLHILRNPVGLSLQMHARLEIVENAHGVSLLEKQVHNVRADQTRSSCHQCLHYCDNLLTFAVPAVDRAMVSNS